MLKKLFLVFIFSIFAVLVWGSPAKAGFGISPPYVRSDKLTPGSHYEQRINLLRSSAEGSLKAIITINAPDIESWISIKEGNTVLLPKDQLRVPMIVEIDVPDNAPLGNYLGHINVRVVPDSSGSGGVAITLGARIEIDLIVTDEDVPDFKIRTVAVPDFETLGKPWNWRIFAWFFYRIKVNLNLENTGNVAVAPSKVHLDVYNVGRKKLLESSEDTSLKKVEPYTTRSTTATFPTRLSPGSYWAKIKVYKKNEVTNNYEIAFRIHKYGTMKGGPPPLGPWPWIMLSGMIAVALIILLILIKIRIWRYIFRLLYLISWPVRMIWRGMVILYKKIKLIFWKWVHRKSQKYQMEDTPAVDKDSQENKDLDL